MAIQKNVFTYRFNFTGHRYVRDLQEFLKDTLSRDSLSEENRERLTKIQGRIKDLDEKFGDNWFIGVLGILNEYGVRFPNIKATPLWTSSDFQYHTTANGDAYYHVCYIPMQELEGKDGDGDDIYLLPETGEEAVIKTRGGSPECFATCVIQPPRY